ncbi:MAG: hypothetical protein DME47_01740 [Verrucomicrobia bacterium]|nr:MAG: hypothetical protein DME47_01740 [Verrucomicrobiota bacterium]
MPNSKQIKLSRLHMKRHLVTCAGILAIGCSALATTVIPPSFDELVSRAEVIFQGTVTDVRSQWVGEGGQRHINSYVTFKVEDAIKGKPGAQITLQMLGGTVGSETMEVTDAPKFKVGDRDILFVENNGTQFVPLVGIMHGRFRVKKDKTGRDAVFTNEGSPLSDVTQLGKNEAAASAGQATSAQDLKHAIHAKALAESAQP